MRNHQNFLHTPAHSLNTPTVSAIDAQLMLLGTCAMKSSGSVRELKRDEHPLFRGKSPGFVDLPLGQHVAKLTGPSRSILTERRECGRGFRFHSDILNGNVMPVTTLHKHL